MTNENAYQARKEPRQERARVTYDAILEAAAQLLEEKGYAATTTNRIAERAGVSIGSVYEYFPGKDAIFAALKSQLDSETIGFVLGALRDVENKTPAELLRSVLRARIGAALERPRLEALLRAEIPASVFEEQSIRFFDDAIAGFRAFAERHVDQVRIAPEHFDEAAHLGLHVVELLVTHYAATQPERLRDPVVEAELTDMMTRWILGPPGS